MACKECERLHNDAFALWNAYLERKHAVGLVSPEEVDTSEDPASVLRAYKLAAARQRVHQCTEHPDENHKVRQEDLDLIFPEAAGQRRGPEV
jgi:hypothetical protein